MVLWDAQQVLQEAWFEKKSTQWTKAMVSIMRKFLEAVGTWYRNDEDFKRSLTNYAFSNAACSPHSF